MQKFITCFAGETNVENDAHRFVVVFAPFKLGTAPANAPCDDPTSFDSILAPLVQDSGRLEAHLRR